MSHCTLQVISWGRQELQILCGIKEGSGRDFMITTNTKFMLLVKRDTRILTSWHISTPFAILLAQWRGLWQAPDEV